MNKLNKPLEMTFGKLWFYCGISFMLTSASIGIIAGFNTDIKLENTALVFLYASIGWTLVFPLVNKKIKWMIREKRK